MDGLSSRLGLEAYRPLLERLLALLREHLGEDLLAVALFGSIARGQGNAESDIDLIIAHRGEREAAEEKFLRVSATLREEPGTPEIYPIFFSEERLARDIPWLLLDVQDHGITLYDPEGMLERTLNRLRKRLKELGSRKVILEDGSWYWDLKPDWKLGEVFEL
jgi:predicted nucleotidyltransferase